MMNDRLKAFSPSPVASQNALTKFFAEDATPAQHGLTPKASRNYSQFNPSATKRQVRRVTQIPALDPAALPTAIRAVAKALTRSQLDLDKRSIRLNRIDRKSIGREPRALKPVGHPLILR